MRTASPSVPSSADGAAAVHHDAGLPDGRAIVELSSADLPGWVPLLPDALDACHPMGVNVEIKNDAGEPDFDAGDDLAGEVCAQLSKRDRSQPYLLSSFRWESMAHARSTAPEIPTALLGFDLDAQLIETALAGGHMAVHPHVDFLNAENVATARAAGLQVNTWTINDPERSRELSGFGVAGVVTDLPDIAVAALST